VRPFPDVKAGRWQVSFGGGVHPAWNPAASELFFVDTSGGARLMGAQIAPGPVFGATQPKVVVNSPVFRAYGSRSYDISPDGKRFLVVESTADENSSASIIVVLNWAAGRR
jgi:hypothetical protein